MLYITIPEWESYNNLTGEFSTHKEQKLALEHSLVSLSKWESKHHKPFLASENKTAEEVLDYVRCMTVTQNPDPECYRRLTRENISKIRDYIDDSMTATWFNEKDKNPSHEVVTNELIYYWMIQAQIPFECQKWHLNRLLTLIRVCSAKSAPAKKMGRKDMIDQRNALNAERKAKLKTKG